jgi:hypothetical protein
MAFFSNSVIRPRWIGSLGRLLQKMQKAAFRFAPKNNQRGKTRRFLERRGGVPTALSPSS